MKKMDMDFKQPKKGFISMCYGKSNTMTIHLECGMFHKTVIQIHLIIVVVVKLRGSIHDRSVSCSSMVIDKTENSDLVQITKTGGQPPFSKKPVFKCLTPNSFMIQPQFLAAWTHFFHSLLLPSGNQTWQWKSLVCR